MPARRMKLISAALVIFATTVGLFWPCVHGEFLRGDDRDYVQQAARRNGLTWDAVKWAFTEPRPYYQPLPRFSFVLEYQIWGNNPSGYHATNVILHALNAVLVFGFLWTLLGTASLTASERLGITLVVTAVFAIHPLQVESVAWMAGRTQLLCAAFGIGGLWAYASGVQPWAVWGLYAVALLCKPIAVSFPFVMLAMDYYPLRRYERFGWTRLVWEKVPFLCAAMAMGLAQIVMRALLYGLGSAPISQRVLSMLQNLAFYSRKLAWPGQLSPYYPSHLGLSLQQWPVVAWALYAAIMTVLAALFWRRLRGLTAAWAAYLALLLPVSTLIQNDWERTAPRHAYLAMLALLLVVCGGGHMVVAASRLRATAGNCLLDRIRTVRLWNGDSQADTGLAQ